MANGTNGDPIAVKVVQSDTTDPVAVRQVMSGTWKEMVARWVFEQSVSTILLVSILGVIIYGVPTYVIPSIGEGYRENAATLRSVMDAQNQSHERVIKVLTDGHDRDREAFRESFRAR